MNTLEKPLTEEDVEQMIKLINDAPECKCEASHTAVTKQGAHVKMPTPCTGEASFRFVWPVKGEDYLVCNGWAKDFNQMALIKDEARLIKI